MSSAGKLKARIVRVRVIENTRNKVELSLKDNSGTIDASVEFTKQVRIRIDHAMNLWNSVVSLPIKDWNGVQPTVNLESWDEMRECIVAEKDSEKLFNKPIREVDPSIPRRDIDWNQIQSRGTDSNMADYAGIIVTISSPKTVYRGLVILSVVVLDDKSNKVSLILSNHYCLLASKLKIGDFIIASNVEILNSIHPEILVPQMILNERSLLEINPDIQSYPTYSEMIRSYNFLDSNDEKQINFIHGKDQEGIWSQNLNGEVDFSKLNDYIGVSYGPDQEQLDSIRKCELYRLDDINQKFKNMSPLEEFSGAVLLNVIDFDAFQSVRILCSSCKTFVRFIENNVCLRCQKKKGSKNKPKNRKYRLFLNCKLADETGTINNPKWTERAAYQFIQYERSIDFNKCTADELETFQSDIMLNPVLIQFRIFWSDYLKMPQLILTSCQNLDQPHMLTSRAWNFIIQGLDKKLIQHETEIWNEFDKCVSSQDKLASLE